jgi:signal peptidase I
VAAVAVIAALLVRSFVFEAFYIPSQSMQPTLYPDDRVVVNELSYDFHSVHTGDIIVFRRPPWDSSSTAANLIKRVVGLPGQLIGVHNCRVYINGKLLAQPYLPKGWQSPSSPYCTEWDQPGMLHLSNPYRVPAGDYFVMGDNRQDSADSRYWGALPSKYIIGRAFLEVWPVSQIRFL